MLKADPDPRVGPLQAQTCNMRSKCRCSCVLQFTLCHASSCVLHRPPSQLIHCIALYLIFFSLEMNPHNSSCPRSGTEPGRLGRKDRRPALARAARPRSRSLLSRGNRGPAWWATKHRRQTAGLQSSGRAARAPVRQTRHCWLRAGQLSVNDPSAGSPTETLLRLLLPLGATV